jgi:hypothetical protein
MQEFLHVVSFFEVLTQTKTNENRKRQKSKKREMGMILQPGQL